jgi:hypothetical protein
MLPMDYVIITAAVLGSILGNLAPTTLTTHTQVPPT